MYTNVVFDASGDFVKLEMKTGEAKRMFHDINRLMSLLDLFRLKDDGESDTMHALNSADQASYNRVNDLLADMQIKLSIEPGDND